MEFICTKNNSAYFMGYILGFLCYKWQHKWGMQGFYPCLMLFYERFVSRFYDHTYVIKVGAHSRDYHEKKKRLV